MSRMDSVNLGKKDHSLEIKFDMIFDQQTFFVKKSHMLWSILVKNIRLVLHYIRL